MTLAEGPKYLYGTKYGFCSSNFPYGSGKYSPYGYFGPFGFGRPLAFSRPGGASKSFNAICDRVTQRPK